MANRSSAKLTLFAILLITATGLTAGSPADISVFPKESSTRIDSFTSYEVEVTNSGPTMDRYTMSASTTEATVAPQDIRLDTGETETVNVWYNPETDRDEGTYSFQITARSEATGERYSSSARVNIIKDHDVSISVDDQKTVCRGEEATYQVQITNDGIQAETFDLETDYGDLSTGEVTLQEGETKRVTVTASSDNETTENFNIRAMSTTSYAQDIRNLQLNVETCYDSDVVVTPGSQEVAAGTPAQYTVTIRNLGTKGDTFTVSSSQGDLSATEIDVPAGESREVNLAVTPEQLGEQEVTVTASSNVESIATLQMDVYNGNDVEVGFSDAASQICETGTHTYTADLENTGEAADTYSVSTDTGNISTEEVALQPGQSEEVDVTVDATEFEENSSQSLTLDVQSQTFEEPSESATHDFRVQNCWDVSMEVVPQVQSAGENRSVIYEINLNNPGEKENTYQLSHEGPEWVSVRPEELTVAPGATETGYIYAGIPFQKQGQVEITAEAVGTEVQTSKTVELVIGEDVEEAIKDESGEGITGAFTDSFSGAVDALTSSGSTMRIIASIILGMVIVGFILYRG